MTKAAIILNGKQSRAQAVKWIASAPDGTTLELRKPKRSIPQNARMWAMLSDIASQTDYHGMKLSADDWKLIFMDGLGHELRIVPNLTSTGFVNLGRSSSRLSVSEMSDLQTLMEAYAAEHEIDLRDSERVPSP